LSPGPERFNEWAGFYVASSIPQIDPVRFGILAAKFFLKHHISPMACHQPLCTSSDWLMVLT
jgi:hypothetical protein